MNRFQTTRWSLVLQARGDDGAARPALEALCRAYRPPALAYVRSRGYGSHAAEDLVQAFFERFLEHAWHAGADPDRGRFRAYLLTMLKRHLMTAAAELATNKRGGAAIVESIDDASESLAADASSDPDQSFERAWAVTVLGRAFEELRQEAERSGKQVLFDALREFLIERPDEADYARVASELGLRRNTLAVAVHRLRNRLRTLIHAELTDTTEGAADLQRELHDLNKALDTARP